MCGWQESVTRWLQDEEKNRRAIRKVRAFFSNHQFLRAAQLMGPTLIALTFSGVTHAQGPMDFSGNKRSWKLSKRSLFMLALLSASAAFIFAGIRMLSGRSQDAIPELFDALFGADVLGC